MSITRLSQFLTVVAVMLLMVFACEQRVSAQSEPQATPVPTREPVKTRRAHETETARPTATEVPTQVPTDPPTATNVPPPTATSTPLPPTATNVPPPTATSTPLPPTATATTPPTLTPIPPSATPTVDIVSTESAIRATQQAKIAAANARNTQVAATQQAADAYATHRANKDDERRNGTAVAMQVQVQPTLNPAMAAAKATTVASSIKLPHTGGGSLPLWLKLGLALVSIAGVLLLGLMLFLVGSALGLWRNSPLA